jgi:FkbM family methyltransferase
MNVQKLGEHSVDLDKIDNNGWILDVGCRRFDFSKAAAQLGCNVLALDPGTIDDPKINRVRFLNVALVADPNLRSGEFYEFGGGAGSFMSRAGTKAKPGAKRKTVRCVDLGSLMQEFGIETFEAVKLDCEGSEYEILLHWPGPIAKQISVEFHDFHEMKRPKPLEQMGEYYDAMFRHLGQWYEVLQHEPTLMRNISTPNYWDSLFVLRKIDN